MLLCVGVGGGVIVLDAVTSRVGELLVERRLLSLVDDD